MSRIQLKTRVIPAATAIAMAVGYSSLWAQSASDQATHSITQHLAMMDMDDMMKMDKMEKKGGMANMPDKKMKGKMPMPADSAMPAASPGAHDSMSPPSSVDMMGRMRAPMQGRQGMKNMTPAASLPGFPGASHLYHVGATGFFLDHSQHINLSISQQTALNQIKEKSALNQASSSRRLEDLEQELWLLTSAEAPDSSKIDAKVRAIETLRAEQRLAFIRAVGEAGKILNPDQQAAVLGTTPMSSGKPSPAAGKAMPMPMPAPMPAPAMPPMKME